MSFRRDSQQTLAPVAILLVMNSSPVLLWASRSFVWTSCGRSDGRVYGATASQTHTQAARALRTEPLKVRKVFSSSSSEKIGWRATKLMNLPSARLLPSMKSRSEMEVSTAERRQRNGDFSRRKRTPSYKWLKTCII